MVRTIDDGSYLSVPAMESRKRRLFTFTNPLLLSHDGSIVATAAEGMEDGERDETGMRFLVLDALWDGMIMKRLQLDGLDAVIGVWVNPSVIASEQVKAPSLLSARSILDLSNDRIEAQRLLVKVAEDARDLISCNCSYDLGSEERCDGTCTQGMATRALTLLGRVPR